MTPQRGGGKYCVHHMHQCVQAPGHQRTEGEHELRERATHQQQAVRCHLQWLRRSKKLTSGLANVDGSSLLCVRMGVLSFKSVPVAHPGATRRRPRDAMPLDHAPPAGWRCRRRFLSTIHDFVRSSL
jgi:hypothetical protein